MDLKPSKQELQIPHFCCQCGIELVVGAIVRCSVVSVSKGSILSSHRIAWCDTCWKDVAGDDEVCPCMDRDCLGLCGARDPNYTGG